MTLDVAANAYALLGMEIPSFTVPLLLQTTLFRFVLGSIGFLWPRQRTGVEVIRHVERRLV